MKLIQTRIEAAYSELTILRESITATSVWHKLKRQKCEVGKSHSKKMKTSSMLWLDIDGMWEVYHLMWLVWKTYSLPLAGYELEMGAKK